ncbi:MAG: tetratricopeptide repeat protein [Syntrophobacteraceae bacterium]
MEITGWDGGCEQQSAQNCLEKGEAALCENKHSEAIEYFGQVLKADPFNAKAHSRMSNAYWAQGKTEDALNSLTKALELKPGDRDTVLTCTRFFEALGKEDYSREVLQSYLDKNPQDKEFRSQLDSLAKPADKGHCDDAAEFLRRQGEIEFERGNISHAVACFEMAIGENPLIAEAYNNLGVINLESGKVTEALANFFKALELKPEDTDILLNSARGLVVAAQTDAAIEVYREYLRRCPQDNQAWSQYESLVRKSATLEWNPKGLCEQVADIYLQTAEKLAEAGDLTGASGAVERSLKIKPEAPEALFVLASLHYRIGQKDDAAGILDHALTIDPSHPRCSEMLKSIRNGNGA